LTPLYDLSSPPPLNQSFYSQDIVKTSLTQDIAKHKQKSRAIAWFRLLWVLVIPLGACMSLQFICLVADTLNALMAIPNLIALLVLSPVLFNLLINKAHHNKP
jgi:Na+/alanine symporter